MPDGKKLFSLAIGLFALAIAVQVVFAMLAPYKYWILATAIGVIFFFVGRRVVKAYVASGGSFRFWQ